MIDFITELCLYGIVFDWYWYTVVLVLKMLVPVYLVSSALRVVLFFFSWLVLSKPIKA